MDKVSNAQIRELYGGAEGVGVRIDEGVLRWWIDTAKDCLKKDGLDVRQARRMVHDRSEYEGEWVGRSPRNEPLTLTRCQSCGFDSYMKPLKDGSLSVAKPTS